MILLSTTKKAGSLFGRIALLWAVLLLFPFFGTTQTWTPQASGSTQYLPSSWGIDANNVWIAGWGGTILKWDGSSWTGQNSGTTALLWDVWGIDANNVWAVGSNGTILKWDGSSWTTQVSGTTESLLDIWGSDANNIWAVGGNGTILKWNGSSWTPQASGTTQNFNSIWGADANNIWAGGAFGTIAKWDGSTWATQTQPLGAGGAFYDIWGSDASNVWAATGAAILKWDGNAWTVQPTPPNQFFRGVWGIDPYNVWAVGENGNVHKWDGITWTPQTSGTTQILVSIWGSNADNVWVTGANGTILYSNDQSIAAPPCSSILYVNDDATGNNDGSSWTDAFTDLQDALTSTCPGINQIWVAEGTYVPGTNQADQFEMKDGVDIYGGFPGSPGQEGDFGVRDWVTNVSTLSGEIGTAGLGDNCTNVIIGATAVLDGFTIRDANADGMSVYFVSPTIANCVFTENGSDGIDGGAGMEVTNCAFTNNVENGLNTYGDESIYTNCTFFGNGNVGTAFSSGSNPTLVNCTYSGNNAGGLSGFIGVYPIVKNCIFWGDGGSEFLIIGGSADITNSIVQGGCPTGSLAYTCTNVLDVDPLFVDQANGDLQLQECSPAIDAGDDSANTTSTDLDGNDRTFEAIPGAPTIDVGAYEYQATLTITTYYTDTDGDDYGTGTGQDFCEDPGPGWALQAGDCDDNDPDINPDAPEVCDGVDNNCIDGIDENDICCPSGNILYVNDDASGNNDGSSWADAFTDLQDALALTCPGITEIWVAEGTYYPGTARTDAFVMKNNLAIYGGFPNLGNPGLGDRNPNPAANGTLLSGNIGNGSSNFDNSYHVVNNIGLNATARLDGFTISEGNANDSGSGINTRGGGMLNQASSPTITNCAFTNNLASYGGGMFNDNGSSPVINYCFIMGNTAAFGGGMNNSAGANPSVTNCTFSGNQAGIGGAVYNSFSSNATISSCRFITNTANEGGGVFSNGSLSISNCLFFGNSATGDGGGMSLLNNTTAVINCTFSGNSASQGGGVFNENGNPSFTNCIVWSNTGGSIINSGTSPAVTRSIVQGGYAACIDCPNGNGDIDPLFVSGADFYLQECSPAIDAGTAAGAPNDDLYGNSRPVDAAPGQPGNFDIGAYEFQGATPDPTAVCASNLTVQLDANLTATVTVAQIVDSSDGCGPLSFLIDGESSLSFDCDDVGPQTVTLEVTDQFMNTETVTCSFTVADDNNVCCTASSITSTMFSPASICPGDEVTLSVVGDLGDGTTWVWYEGECPLGAPSPPTIVGTGVSVMVTPSFSTTYFVRAEGGCLVDEACTQVIVVVDAVAPSAVCQNIEVFLDTNGDASIVAADVDGGSDDNCGVASMTVEPNTFDCDDTANNPNEVTLTVFDGVGNWASCMAQVTVRDTISPVLVCQDITFNLDTSGRYMLFLGVIENIIIQSRTDNCDVITGQGGIGIQPVKFEFTCDDLGDNAYTIISNDVNGNQGTCDITITIEDPLMACNRPPVAVCQPVTVNADANCQAEVVAMEFDDGSTDPDMDILTFTASPEGPYGLGPTNVTLTVSDGILSSQCMTTVTVIDATPPSVDCPADATVECDESTLPSATGVATGIDNCGMTTISWVDNFATACGNTGVLTRIWTATDEAGNPSNCTQIITIVDTTPPNITCPADATVECGDATDPSATGMATGSDICGTVAITFSDSSVPGCGNTETI
ncbi:MAG: right-handed parallel beta-helix repeat-containing protein, partial [Lewinella sp.]|uniref:right-handed parallel beta-helix repeat-containing protein n=1 Tax=Lewinella sp. TaxID=2004506 RepID=UPI003D6C5CA0